MAQGAGGKVLITSLSCIWLSQWQDVHLRSKEPHAFPGAGGASTYHFPVMDVLKRQITNCMHVHACAMCMHVPAAKTTCIWLNQWQDAQLRGKELHAFLGEGGK